METSKYNYCHIEGLTDVGCKRPANEDWFDHFECQNGLVAVVCDGMGGHVGGAVASHTAVEAIRAFLENNYFENPNEAIISAVNVGNQAILNRGMQQPELQGMGATCVLLIVRDGYVYYGSVGDSRIYLVRQHHITQLTKDQSYVQMLVDMGQITHEQAEHHPRKNEITNALGLQQMTPAVVREEPIAPEAGDCFILCSDGLSGMVSDQKIMEIASRQSQMKQQERVKCLVEKARENGGLDNITCVMVEYAASPFRKGGKTKPVPSSSPAKPRSRMLTIGLPVAVIALAVVLGGASWWYFSRDKEPQRITGSEMIKEIVANDKDAQFMCYITSPDSVPAFRPGAEFITIKEKPSDFGVMSISWVAANGKPVRIEGPKGLLKTLSLRSTENLMLESDFDIVRKNDTTSVVKFKQTLGKASSIDLVFKDDKGKRLHYVIGIQVPMEAPSMPQDNEAAKKQVEEVKDAFRKKEEKTSADEEDSEYSKTVHFSRKNAGAKSEMNIHIMTGDGRDDHSNVFVGNKVKFEKKDYSRKKSPVYSIKYENENSLEVKINCENFTQKEVNVEILLTNGITYFLTIVNDDYKQEKGK